MSYVLHSRARRALSGIAAALFITTLPLFGLTSAAQPATDPATAPAVSASAAQTTAPAESSLLPANSGDTATADAAATPAPASPQTETAQNTTTATQPTVASAVGQPTPNPTLQQPASTTEGTAQTGDGTSQTAIIRNNTDSSATSGNATLSGNDDVGDARSGEATAEVTHVNVVNSTLNGNSGTAQPMLQNVHVRNIYNDAGADSVQGNILIDPASLVPLSGSNTQIQSGSVQPVSSLVDIENNIDLDAVSGNATVSGNDDAGSAVSGDATALANVINIVNSSVGAERSFVGVINIFGDLHGDIQVPRSFVDSLLADSPAVDPATGQNGGNPGPVSTAVNIENNIDLDAVSGDALVTGNDNAGDARSGDATTHLNVYNLTGQEVVARNSLLVFINVMGRWVGMIMNAPGGESTSAALGGGVTTSSQAGSPGDTGGGVDSTVNIRNNVSVSARSGDATVSGNDDAGGATTGNARAGANILNLVHSSFNLDDWFGALFINVLGSWLGNFSILDDSPAPGSGGGDTGAGNASGGTPPGTVQAVRVFRFEQDTRFRPDPQQPAGEGAVAGASATAPPAAEPAAVNPVAAASAKDTLTVIPEATHSNRGLSAVAILSAITALSLIAVLTVVARRRYAGGY